MFKVGDRIFILYGAHQNETGEVTAVDSWAMDLTITVDGWPGKYNINSESCIRVVPRDPDPEPNLSVGMPTWTH